MSYIYKVGYESFEESPSDLLESEINYSQIEFDELVSNCYAEIYNTFKNNTYSPPSVSNIYNLVRNILVSKYSFKLVAEQCSFMPFGWASIIDYEDWKNEVVDDMQLKLIRDKCSLLN